MPQRLTSAEWMNLYPEFAKLPGWLKMELSRKENTEAETAISHQVAMIRSSQIADTLRSEGSEAAIAHPYYAKLRDYLMENLSEEDLEAALAPKVESASEDDAATDSEDDAATVSEDDAAAASEADADSDSDANSDSDAASEIDNTSEVVTRSKVGTAAKAAAARAAAQEQENHKNLKRKFAHNKLCKEQAAVRTGAGHKKRKLSKLVSEPSLAEALHGLGIDYIQLQLKKQWKHLRRMESKFFDIKMTREEAGRAVIAHELTKLRDTSKNKKLTADADAALECMMDAHWEDDHCAIDLLEEIECTKTAIKTFETLRDIVEESKI